MTSNNKQRAATIGLFLLGITGLAPAHARSASEEFSTGVAVGAFSVAVVPVAVSIAVPASTVGALVAGATHGFATTAEAMEQGSARQSFDQPLPITDQTLIVGPSPRDAIRGGGR